MMPWFNDVNEEGGKVTNQGGSLTKLVTKKIACCALLVLMAVATGNITRGSAAPSSPELESNSYARTLQDVVSKGQQIGQHKDTLGSSTMKLGICAIVKDEGPYLSEWIEHHKLIGFDTILLYNDHSTDDTQCVLDSYAEQGFVLRVPDDIGGKYMKDLPWRTRGQIDNIQKAIFEACRRYLADEEQKNGEVGSTWMLTNDVDEFVWFDENKYRNLKTALSSTLSAISVERPDAKSVSLPNCIFGSSGKDTYEPGLVMQRFIHRDKNFYCESLRAGTKEGRATGEDLSFAMAGKGFSRVASLVEDQTRPHMHKVRDDQTMQILRTYIDAQTVGMNMKLAHYKTKSREEFFDRTCISRYVEKYFDPSHTFNNGGRAYPGCCSPGSFFNYMNHHFAQKDNMMQFFAQRLESRMSNFGQNCTRQVQQKVCPDSLMMNRNNEGLSLLQQHLEHVLSPSTDEY